MGAAIHPPNYPQMRVGLAGFKKKTLFMEWIFIEWGGGCQKEPGPWSVVGGVNDVLRILQGLQSTLPVPGTIRVGA